MRRFFLCGLTAPISAFGVVIASVDAIAQDNRLRDNASTTPAVSTTEVHAWKTIEIGGRKGVRAYRNALDAAAVRIGDSANEILGRPAFRYADGKPHNRSGTLQGLTATAATLRDRCQGSDFASLSGNSGHGAIFGAQRSVANDPERTKP